MRASAPLVLAWSGFEAVSAAMGFKISSFHSRGLGFHGIHGRGSGFWDRVSGPQRVGVLIEHPVLNLLPSQHRYTAMERLLGNPSCFENMELSLPDTQRWKVCLRTFHAFRTKSLRRNQTVASHAGKDTSTIGEDTRSWTSSTRQPSPPTRLTRTTVHRVLVNHRQGLRFA